MAIGLTDKLGKATLPNQRVSTKEKQTKDWTRQMATYVVNLAVGCNDKSKVRTFLDMANGKVDKSMYEYVLKTHGISENEIKKEKLIENLREIDFLQPIKDHYLGEFTSSYNNYQVYTDDPDTVFLRNKTFGNKVLEVMGQKLINELNKTMNTGQETKQVPDIEVMLDEYISEWNDERATAAQLRLNLLNSVIDAKVKYNQAYYYWWACEEVYTYRQVHKNDVLFEVVSPLEYYRIPSSNTYVEDDDYGVRIFSRSLYTILDMYDEFLTDKDRDYLHTITRSDLNPDVRINLLKSRCIENGMSPSDYLDNQNTINNDFINNSGFNNPDNISLVHYVAKTEVKVGYLTFLAPDGSTQETVVAGDYILDTDGGDISIKYDWIQEMWQGEIIGYGQGTSNEAQAIYTKFRPIDTQREKFTNLNICKSPYNGLSSIHRDSEKKPIPYRVNTYMALARIYHYQIEKAIQKWKSILLIPQSFLTDDANMSMEQRLSHMESSSILAFNDGQVNPNAVQSMREIATTATFNFVSTLMGLLQTLKQDAWEVSNMTPSRMGNQPGYQGKSVTENSMEQATISSNWSLEMFNLFRAKDYLANYDTSKVAWSEGKQGSFIDESTGAHSTVAVDPMEHMSLNIGINVGNSRLLDEKLKAMKEVAFSAAQNGEFEMAIEAILNDNLQSLRSKILKVSKANKIYKEQMAQAEQQSALQIEQTKQQTEQFKADNKLKEIQLTNDGMLQKALVDQETQLLVWDKRLSIDTNADGYISNEEEVGNGLLDAKYKAMQMDLKYKEYALKAKKVQNDISKSNVAK